MAITVPSYTQNVDLGGAPDTPAANVRYVESGIGDAIQQGANEFDRAAANLAHVEKQKAETESTLALSKLHLAAEDAFIAAQGQARPDGDQFTPGVTAQNDKLADEAAKGLSTEQAIPNSQGRVRCGCAGDNSFRMRNIIYWR